MGVEKSPEQRFEEAVASVANDLWASYKAGKSISPEEAQGFSNRLNEARVVYRAQKGKRSDSDNV